MAKGVNPFSGRKKVSTGMLKGTQSLLSMSIEAPGLDEAIERLQRYAKFGDTDAKRVRAGMQKTVKLVRGQAEKTVPIRFGDLKTSVFGKTKTFGDGNVMGSVGSSWRMPRALIPLTLEGGRIANRRGRMAIKPRRWLYRAFAMVKSEVDHIWQTVLAQIANDLAGKG